MAKLNSGKQKSNKVISLLSAKEFLFNLDGQTLNVEDATDEQFDTFIRQHVDIGWSLEERVDAINLALEQGKTLGVMSPTPEEEVREKSNKN